MSFPLPRIRRAWRFIVWLTLLCGLQVLEAQRPSFRRFDVNDGLPQSQVFSFLEDRNGFIWLGTQGGVARMGSGGFKVFDLSSGLGAGRVEAFLEDAEGGIWIAQTGTALARIHGTRIETFGAAQGLPEVNCFSLALTQDHRVLVGTGHGLYRSGPKGFEQVHLGSGWDDQRIQSMAHDRNGRIWVGTRSGRIGSWDGTTITAVTLPVREPDLQLHRLKVDGQNQLWAMTRKTLWRRTQEGRWEAWRPPGFPLAPRFEDLSISVDGCLVIALGGEGLWLQPSDAPPTRYTSQDGLPVERISTAFKDHRGILWIGTDGGGMCALVFQGLLSLTHMGDTPLGPVLSLAEVPGRGVFLGTGRGLFQTQGQQGVVRRWWKDQGIPGTEIWGLCADGKEGLWVGTDAGMVRLQGDRITAVPSFKDARVYQILDDAQGFIAATDQGLFHFDGEGRVFETINLAEYDLPRNVVILGREGKHVVVGTARGLWNLVQGKLERRFPDAPFANLEVSSLYQHPSGRLWVGTPQGLYIQQSDGWTFLTTPKDLPDGYIYLLGDAGDGLVAVGHGKGVTLMDGQGRSFYLNQSLGLVSNETNQGSVFRDSLGRLWIGTITGANLLVNRERLRLPGLPPPTVLEATFPGGSLAQPTQVNLPARSEFVEFNFEAGLPITTHPPIYEVMLEGLSATWQRIGEVHQIRYPRLAGGSYRFRVRASLDGQQWIESPAVGLTIQRTWLEHPAGKGVLALLGLLGVLLLVRWRTFRLERAAKELEAKVEDRTRALDARNQELEEAHRQVHKVLESKLAFTRMVVHDLRAPVTTLSLLVDQASLELEDHRQPAPPQFSLIHQEAGRLESLLHRLLDQARSEAMEQSLYLVPVPPAATLKGLDDVLRIKAESMGIRFELEQDPVLMDVTVMADPLAIQQIVMNLVGNALKYTPTGGRVGLRSLREDDAWVLEIWDTGRGMDPLAIDRLLLPFTQTDVSDAGTGWGLGLNIVKRLVEAHHGVLDVESTPGQGTTFRIALRIQKG